MCFLSVYLQFSSWKLIDLEVKVSVAINMHAGINSNAEFPADLMYSQEIGTVKEFASSLHYRIYTARRGTGTQPTLWYSPALTNQLPRNNVLARLYLPFN